MDNFRGTRIGNCLQGEGGYFVSDDGGGWPLRQRRQEDQAIHPVAALDTTRISIKAVRSRKREDQNADIEVGHISAALCHMANTSYRLGKKATVDEIRAAIGDNAEMMDSFDRMLQHLAANEVNLRKSRSRWARSRTMDPVKEQYVGENSELANLFPKRNYREPFVVPEKV